MVEGPRVVVDDLGLATSCSSSGPRNVGAGMSGGPVFKKGTPYGILSGTEPNTACHWFYSSAASAERELNVKIETG
jgi:hypothetical protein